MPTATADRVGFIGGGMMASALMGGLVKARAVPSSSSIAVSEPYTPMREKHLKNGFAATTSNAEVVQRSDTIVLAVKPDVIPAVLRECAAAVGTAKLVVSIAAGVPLRTLYGQTETLGAFTLHKPDEVDPDTTGVSMAANIEIEIRDPDVNGVGEIVVRHPNMFSGYYKNEAATAVDMRDGWMHSGDAGYFNKAKQLVVIDRIKDLAQTSHGDRFSPQYIENKLKFSPYVAEAVVLGDGRGYLAAMLCIRFSIVSKWAEKNRLSFTTYTDLSSRPETYELLRKEVEAVNATLPPAQRISKFLLLYKELDADDGELTRTRKVRRTVINDKYGDIINAIYGDRPDIDIDTVIRFQDGTTQRIRCTLPVIDLGARNKTAEAAE